MTRLFLAALIALAAFSTSFPQDTKSTQSADEIFKQAHAPSQPGGIGRAVVVVTDANGNPIKGAYVKLESIWGGDNLCESWNWSGDNGTLALKPIHMGSLKMTIKAKGYKTQKIEVPADSLSQPVRVTLASK